VSEVPSVDIGHTHEWDKGQRGLIAAELERLAAQIRAGVFGSIPPGQVAVHHQAEPVQGMHMKVTCTRPGPLP
jgi:hypothetical protein